MRQDGNGSIQPGRALAFDDQKPKEHAKGCCALFGRGPSAVMTFLQRKLSQAPSIKPAWLVSKSFEQPANGDAVVVEGPLTSATLLAHPPGECCQEKRILNG